MSRTYLFLFILSFVCLHYACDDNSVITDPSAQLEFSRDTIRFDTVFTQVGSATRSFKVINPHDLIINISSIQLGNRTDQFRLNIDGVPTNSAKDIVILPNDSLWIFVEVTINPDMPVSVSPFVLEEEVFFETNGNDQSVRLEAWGQNANYIPNRFSAGAFSRISCNNDSLRFDDPKPYVFYGVLVIDSCHVAFPPGTEIYVHGGVAKTDEDVIFNDGLVVFTNTASLQSYGNVDNPVTITGDRLESVFDDVSGQWAGIRFLAGSRGNKISHTKITNSLVGVRVDSSAFLRIEDSEIRNTAGAGIIGIHSTIIGTNCLVADNGSVSGLFTFGGSYTFLHSTFANYRSQTAAIRLDNFACINNDCANGAIANRLVANFTNCIITGSDPDEVDLQDLFEGAEPQQFSYNFKNSLVTIDELLDPDQFPNFFDNCEDCVTATRDDELFIDYEAFDYHLDTMSVAIGKGFPVSIVPVDIEGVMRDPATPDLGCYEFVE